MLNEKDFYNMGKIKCSLIKVVVKNSGILGGPYYAEVDHEYNGNMLHIEITQGLTRTICISANSQATTEQLWEAFSLIERLLMVFDGRFYIIESVSFSGEVSNEVEYSSYAQECISRRLSYCHTDPTYCYSHHVFLRFNTVLSSTIISKWVQLQDELDIVHQVALYNVADTGITHDVKCANFIECLEPMVEIIGLYDCFFPCLKPGDRTTTLKMCIDAVISKYGKDIFAEEYSANKEKFLQILVNTRNRVMHIKRNQPTEKYLSGEESVLYLVKLSHLYRVVILSLLGIDYAQYQCVLIKSVQQWNKWNGVLDNFIKGLK